MTYLQQVRFEHSPKLHWMGGERAHPVNTQVVVQSRRGLELARVRGAAQASENPAPGEAARAGQILRAASAGDLERAATLAREAEDLKWSLRARAREMPVKIVACEFTLDGALLTVSYSADERVDLGKLVQDVRAQTEAKVNFLAVGPREQVVALGALGACGREACSSTHLQDFAPISIRMARDQQLPLNPEKLSGPCGRLLCCLQYEHTQYQELLRDLPRKNAKVCHDESGACGKVVKLNPLAGTVDMYGDQGYMGGLRPEELSPIRGEK